MLRHKARTEQKTNSVQNSIYPKIHSHLIALRPLFFHLQAFYFNLFFFNLYQTLSLEVRLKFHSSDSEASNVAQLQSQVLKSQPAGKSCDRTSLRFNFTLLLYHPRSPTHHALPPDGCRCRSPCSSHRVASARINTPISPKAKLSLSLKLYLRAVCSPLVLFSSGRAPGQPTPPSPPTPRLLRAAGSDSGALREKKKKKCLPAQLGSAQLGSVQPFSYTRPTLHLCE